MWDAAPEGPFTSLAQDLTGSIVKDGSDYFISGDFYDLYSGRWTERQCDTYGSLTVKVVKVYEGIEDDLVQQRRLLRETVVWSQIKHRNVVPLLGVCFGFVQSKKPCLVYPSYRKGTILQYLNKNPHANRMKLAYHIASGLQHLHDRSIIHGDLKAENVLIEDQGNACLAGFHLSSVLPPSTLKNERDCYIQQDSDFEHFSVHYIEDVNPVTTAGWRWRAPEIMASSDQNESNEMVPQFTCATDVYAFGMTVYEIFSGSVPYAHIRSDARVIIAVVSGAIPRRGQDLKFSDETWELLRRCWSLDPSQRPGMSEVKNFFATQACLAAEKRSRL